MLIPGDLILKIDLMYDIILMAASREELLLARDSLIFLLQQLRFLINVKNSILTLTSISEILGIEIDSLKITFNLSQDKVKRLHPQCRDFLKKNIFIVWELSKMIDKITSTTVSVLPAPLLVSINTRDINRYKGGSLRIDGGEMWIFNVRIIFELNVRTIFYNQFHNVLPKFSFTTNETMPDCYL